MDKSTSLVQTVCQGFFIIAATIFSLSWLLNILKKYYSRTCADLSRNNGVSEVGTHTQEQQAECRQKMQENHNFKASYYKENIMKPKEEAKRLKKEKEFFKMLGLAYQTEGTVLGGDNSQTDDDESDLPQGRKAARRRKISEHINQKVAAAIQRPKRMIKLPEEPDMNQEDIINVMLRTPIGTVIQRRFYLSDNIQCLLDFMTTKGFSYRKYRLCTSFPRILLDNPNSCFSDYNFGKRIAFNVEEID